MAQRTAIINYATGNLRSIWRALNRCGVAADVVSDPSELKGGVDKLILPGVGNFARAMSVLRRSSLLHPLNELVLDRGVPVLGVCLGLELMGLSSEEGRTAGLGWLQANVVRFRPEIANQKVPYIGWNSVSKRHDGTLMRQLGEDAEFYFLHSYHLHMLDDKAVVGETTYSATFPSVIEQGNIFGVQFHPERSHRSGERVLKNFLEL